MYTDQSITEARARGDKEIRLIVGSYSLFGKEQRLTFLRLFHREGHPLSKSRREAQASHRGAHTEVGPRKLCATGTHLSHSPRLGMTWLQ